MKNLENYTQKISVEKNYNFKKVDSQTKNVVRHEKGAIFKHILTHKQRAQTFHC